MMHRPLFLVTSKGKSKKNPVKEIAKPLPNEAEKKQNSKEQNATIQKDNPETKNVKNTRKGNTRKAAPRGKPDAAAEKTNDAQTEEGAPSEMDVKENGDAHTAEPKQKKRNVGKANVEAKEKQKKGQVTAASVDVEEATEDVTAENETTETNVASEIDGNDTKDVSLDSKDYSILLVEQKHDKIEINDSTADSVKDEVISPIADTSSNEEERSGSFLFM